jgi:hypothetical protein
VDEVNSEYLATYINEIYSDARAAARIREDRTAPPRRTRRRESGVHQCKEGQNGSILRTTIG